MKRGRPTQSVIRQNIVEILHHLGEGYGYDISKIYNEVFPPVTQRSIYYHLKKGTKLDEFKVHRIQEERGEYSWGTVVEKIYYTLSTQAEPKGEQRVKEYIASKTGIIHKIKRAFRKK